ncbi:MAG: hypothetical protein ACRC62_03840 [Microcoleus sp.]
MNATELPSLTDAGIAAIASNKPNALTMDDLERMKQLAHYQKLVRESDWSKELTTLAHYQAMLCQVGG